MTHLTRRQGLALGLALAGTAALPLPLRAENAAADPRLSEIVIGSPDAPVELIEYGSFTCPHCARFETAVMPELMTTYITPGKLRLVFRSVFRNRYDLWATMLVRCGDGQRRIGLLAEVFRTQAQWTTGDDAAVAANLRRIGKLAAIPDEALNACMADQTFANALVKAFMDDPLQAQVSGTPTFFLNGKKIEVEELSFAFFQKVLDPVIN